LAIEDFDLRFDEHFGSHHLGNGVYAYDILQNAQTAFLGASVCISSVCIWVYTHTYICVWVRVYVCGFVCVCVVYAYRYTHTCVCVCVCVSECMYVGMSVCV